MHLSRNQKLSSLFLVAASLTGVHAADHIDFPDAMLGTEVEGAADITDVFAWIPSEGRLALVMDLYPDAPEGAQFSDAVDYQFRLRAVEIEATDNGLSIPRAQEDTEWIIRCSRDAEKMTCQAAQCHMDGKDTNCSEIKTVSTAFDAIEGSPDDMMRVFAGQRAEPFYLDLNAVKATIVSGFTPDSILPSPKLLMPGANPKNFSDTYNVLSIVVEIDVQAFFGTQLTLAVAGETARRGGK